MQDGIFLWGSFDAASTPLLYVDGFNFPNKKARFALSDWVKPVEFAVENDLHIYNGRLLKHFHESNMTNKSDGIQAKYLRISKGFTGTCKRKWRVKRFYGVSISPNGALKLTAHTTDRVKKNELFLPMIRLKKNQPLIS